MADNPAGFTAEELQSVGVFLLWHEAAAGAVRVGQGHALGVVVDDQVFRQLGEVRESHGDPPEVLRHEVSVADGVLRRGTRMRTRNREPRSNKNIKIEKKPPQ